MTRYECCDHCLVFWGECADGDNNHAQPCPEGCERGTTPVEKEQQP